jgi:hypothetical protein
LEQRNFFSLPCAQQFSDAPMPGGGEYISDRLKLARMRREIAAMVLICASVVLAAYYQANIT